MLNVVMLSVVILNVVMLSVIRLSVVAPAKVDSFGKNCMVPCTLQLVLLQPPIRVNFLITLATWYYILK